MCHRRPSSLPTQPLLPHYTPRRTCAQVYIARARLEQRSHNLTAARTLLQEASERARAQPAARAEGEEDATGAWAEVFNAWAVLESKAGGTSAALEILERGRDLFPRDS